MKSREVLMQRSTRLRSARARRGQGTVELALGTLLFVTILLAGIQFAEIGFLSLKVQEAANFAVWHATTKRVHKAGDPSYSGQVLGGVLSEAGERATSRYQDFQAHDSGGNGVSTTQVLIKGSALNVTCAPASGLIFEIDDAGGWKMPATILDPLYSINAGGISCRATASLSSLRNPDKFAQRDGKGGFFTELNNKMSDALTVCSTGRASGGNCAGTYPILLGDWGLLGMAEGARIEHNQENDNRVYFGVTRSAYEAVGGEGSGGAVQFANTFAGGTPGAIGFNMSFHPWKEGKQTRPQHPNIGDQFHTDGVEPTQQGRENCFLGMSGCN